MRQDGLELGVDVALQHPAVVPARNQGQPVPVQDLAQLVAVARKLAAKLGTRVARLAGFG